MNLLLGGCCSFKTRPDICRINEIKEKLCYVAQDFDGEMKKDASVNQCEMDDKGQISLGNERFLCPEALFRPAILESADPFDDPKIQSVSSLFRLFPKYDKGYSTPKQGIHEAIFDAIKRSDTEHNTSSDICRNLFSNIVLSGGSSLFPGLSERLQNEVTRLASVDTEVRVKTYPQQEYGAWVGGSALASSPSFQENWITADEFDEYGPSLLRIKGCFV